MENTPAWLPDIICLDGDWLKVEEKLYEIFENDFKKQTPYFLNLEIWHDRSIPPGEKYELGFQHLITRGEETRLPDFRRAERLPWCKPTLTKGDYSYLETDPLLNHIRVWDYLEGSKKINTYVWLFNLDYVAILRKRNMRIGKVAFLITAYHLDGSSKKKSFERKFENRLKEPI
jgi:hypothetical protein